MPKVTTYLSHFRQHILMGREFAIKTEKFLLFFGEALGRQ